MVSLPSLSLGSQLLRDNTVTKQQKLHLFVGVLVSCGLVMYSRDFLILAMVINVITILYYKNISTNTSQYSGVWTNTLVLMSVLIAALYSVQRSLRT